MDFTWIKVIRYLLLNKEACFSKLWWSSPFHFLPLTHSNDCCSHRFVASILKHLQKCTNGRAKIMKTVQRDGTQPEEGCHIQKGLLALCIALYALSCLHTTMPSLHLVICCFGTDIPTSLYNFSNTCNIQCTVPQVPPALVHVQCDCIMQSGVQVKIIQLFKLSILSTKYVIAVVIE